MGRPENHACLVIRKAISVRASDDSLVAAWAESFLYAGSSALLLLLAHFFSQCWYLSFFALTPFLYRIIQASPTESLRLGFLLGLSFFGASGANSLIGSGLSAIVNLACVTGLFALFGWSTGLARKSWGFDPSIVALLWVGLEIGLLRFGFASGVLGEAGFSHPLLHGMVGLFGFVAVSAIIVLLNSVILLAVLRGLEARIVRVEAAEKSERVCSPLIVRNLFAEKVYVVPEGRAPPKSFGVKVHN
jgi:apolipoprotein N-acyltransferase